MFLYLLNEKEGKAFLELATQAMKVDSRIDLSEQAELESLEMELDLVGYKTRGISKDAAISILKDCSIQVKRCIVIEICGMFYADKILGEKERSWLYDLTRKFSLDDKETERLSRWSKDLSDFIEVGLMYINGEK